MRSLRSILSLAAAFAVSAALFVGTPAKASTYEVIYSGPGGDNGVLDLTVIGTTVTGISGESNGIAITGLSGYAGADQQWFYPTASYVDFNGISWALANGDALGLGWTTFNDYGLARFSINPNGYCCGDHPLSLSVSETPLPGALAMFIGGGGLLGFFATRRKKKAGASLMNAVPA